MRSGSKELAQYWIREQPTDGVFWVDVDAIAEGIIRDWAEHSRLKAA